MTTSPESRVQVPSCTSASIAMANLDAQIDAFAHGHRKAARPDHGIRLIDGLLIRHSVTARHADLVLCAALADELSERAPADPDVLVATAHVDATLHRFPRAAHSLARARAAGAAESAVGEVHADILEARGRVREALGTRDAALAAFDEAVRTYPYVSPLPLGSMFFNWGHTWEHQGDHRRAEQSYRVVLRALPGHVRARRGLAVCALSRGDDEAALSAARCATELNPDDPISLGLLGISGRRAGADGHQDALAEAHRLFLLRMAEHPEGWAGHAAEFWLDEGGHPADARRAAEAHHAARPGLAARRLLARARRAEIARPSRR